MIHAASCWRRGTLARPDLVMKKGRARVPILRIALLIVFVQSGCGSPPETPTASTVRRPDVARTLPVANRPTIRLARLPSEQPSEDTPRAPQADDWFEDMTEHSQIRFSYQNGCEAAAYTLLETVGGGVALFDFDRDGDLDLFCNGGGTLEPSAAAVQGRSGALFRNDGEWRFSDVTANVGLGSDDLYTHGCVVGDVNRDGWPDLLITGFGGCRLYLNRAGARFEDVTQSAGLDQRDWFTAAAFGDYDRDGWLDVYVTAYADWRPGSARVCLFDELSGQRRDVCPPNAYAGRQDRLWHNRGDGTFDDVSTVAGLRSDMRGLGVLAVDFDADGWLDWFVANDAQENQLYFGGSQFPMEERGALAGVAYSLAGEREGSMGVDVGDFNGDGRPDLFYTNFTQQDNALLRGDQHRGFVNVIESVGLAGPSRRWVGFGGGFADFDGDGWPDLYVINGHVFYEASECPYRQPPQLFRNLRGQRFEEISQRGGPYFSRRHPGRGAAVGDIDNDGAPDLVVMHQNEPVVLLRNRQTPPHWVRLQLRGSQSNSEALGARVTVRTGDRAWTQWIASGRGYLSQSDLRPLFALPTDSPVDVTVVWPCGATELYFQRTLGTTHELVEGDGQSR